MDSNTRILRKHGLAGAGQAEGIAVVIDVYRAFTCAACMAYLGVDELVLRADPEEVLDLKRERGYLAVGEVRGRKVPGFDLGNSPSRILAAGCEFFAGRTVAQRTSAGVTGAVAAAETSEFLILGSYVTAAAIARYIRRLAPAPPVVSLVAMGGLGQMITPEDDGCADYLEHLLTGRSYNHLATVQRIVEHECTQQFLRGDQPHYPPSDPLYCLQRDLFDFVLVAELQAGELRARRVDVPKETTA
jgi:2-phosphosulfolactate phosphatase